VKSEQAFVERFEFVKKSKSGLPFRAYTMQIAVALVASALGVLVVLELTGRSMLPTLVKESLLNNSSHSLLESISAATQDSWAATAAVAKAAGIVLVALTGVLIGVTAVMTVIKAAEMDFEVDVEEQKAPASVLRKLASIEPVIAKQLFAETMVDNAQLILLLLTHAMMALQHATHPISRLLEEPRSKTSGMLPLAAEYNEII